MTSIIYRFAPGWYTKLLKGVMFYKEKEKILRNSALTFLASILSAIALVAVWYFLRNPFILLLVPIVPIVILGGNYFIQYKRMRNRTEKIEKHIPDFLQLIAANVRSGMTPYQALKFSTREEFGPLKDEIDYATTLSMGEVGLTESLLRIKDRVRSEMMDRVVELLVSSIRSGGKLSQTMMGLANDISSTNQLKKSLESETRSYSMFILLLVVGGTPLLLAISMNFLSLMTTMSAEVGTAEISLFSGEVSLAPAFLEKISLAVIAVGTLSTSVLTGVIKSGRIRDGVLYYPILLSISIGLFFLFREVVGLVVPI